MLVIYVGRGSQEIRRGDRAAKGRQDFGAKSRPLESRLHLRVCPDSGKGAGLSYSHTCRSSSEGSPGR